MLNAAAPTYPTASRWRAAQPWLGSLALHALIVFSLAVGANWLSQPAMKLPEPEPILVNLQAPSIAVTAPKPIAAPPTKAAALPATPTAKPPPAAPSVPAAPQIITAPTLVAAATPSPSVAVTVTSTPSTSSAITVTASQPAPTLINNPAAAAAPTPSPPAPLIHADFKTTYLQNPKPDYPAMSRRLGEAGTVTLWVAVNAAGTVEDLGVLRSSGFARLDAEAVKAIKLWRFTPAKRGGQAVADKVSVPIEFGL